MGSVRPTRVLNNVKIPERVGAPLGLVGLFEAISLKLPSKAGPSSREQHLLAAGGIGQRQTLSAADFASRARLSCLRMSTISDSIASREAAASRATASRLAALLSAIAACLVELPAAHHSESIQSAVSVQRLHSVPVRAWKNNHSDACEEDKPHDSALPCQQILPFSRAAEIWLRGSLISSKARSIAFICFSLV